MNPNQQAHFASSSAPARVIVYTRVDCSLCDVAIETVTQVCAELDQTFALVDVDSSPELRSQWSDYVPVVEVDGVQQGFWRIDEARLRRALGA